MTKFNLPVLFASLLIVIGCSKETEVVVVEDNENPTTEVAMDSIDIFIENLYGTWNWVETRGGLDPNTVNNPELSGHTMALAFLDSTILKKHVDGEPIRMGFFEVGIDSVQENPLTDTEYFYTITRNYTTNLETGEEYEPYYPATYILSELKTSLEDTLVMYDHNVNDGQRHLYVRD